MEEPCLSLDKGSLLQIKFINIINAVNVYLASGSGSLQAH